MISFQKISKWGPKPISNLFDKESRHIVHFEHHSEDHYNESGESDSETEVITSEGRQKSSERTRSIKLHDFGTLSEYEALLEAILQVDPDKRPTILQILGMPFFKDVPTANSDESWHGLCNAPLQEEQLHVLKKIDDDALRSQGFAVFDDMITSDFYPDPLLRHRVLFLGFDMYDRCLLNLKGELNIKLLAYTCCYIACKYFLDESTPPLRVIFQKVKYENVEIIQMEQKILIELLDWKIYRCTVYDLLDDKVNPQALLKVLQTKPAFYGHRIDKLAKIYTQNVSQK